MKYLYGVILSVFCLLFFSPDVSASDLPDALDLLGLSYEEFLEYEIQPDIFEIPSLNLYSDFNPDYLKENHLKVSEWKYITTHNEYFVNRAGSVTIGSMYWGTNQCYRSEINLYNNGELLFDEPGIFTLKVFAYCVKFTYEITYSDGSISSGTDFPKGQSVQFEYDFDNTGNDIVQLKLMWIDGVRQNTGDTYVGFGIVDYGYLVDDEEPEPEEPEVPLVGGDLNGTIEYILSTVVSVVDCLFLLQIVEGVTFGYFILACMIFGLVFSFLFRNMVK